MATVVLYSIARVVVVCWGVFACAWFATAVLNWIRFARPHRNNADHPLLDALMPNYDVATWHHRRIDAPAERAFSAMLDLNIERLGLVRAIFRTRELILRSRPADLLQRASLIDWARSLGWEVLADNPGREVVLGAATRPWEPNPVFRAIPADEFAKFNQPGYVKIAWTISADSLTATRSLAYTETRVLATDRRSRAKFRLYWSFLLPGMFLIRWAALAAAKRSAEGDDRDAFKSRAARAGLGSRPFRR